MRTLDQLPRAKSPDEICLLRVDLNIESKTDAYRLLAVLPTVRCILKKGYRVLLLSHRGRPHGYEKRSSLQSVIPLLTRHLKQRIYFIAHKQFDGARVAFDQSKASIALLENLRFHRGEQEADPVFAKHLASLGSVFVNDAFSVSHRKDASIALLPRLLPAYAGLLLEKEVHSLSHVLEKKNAPVIFVVGGAKVPEKLGFIERMHAHAKLILVGGVTANTLLKARGEDVGQSVVDVASLPLAKKLAPLSHVLLPHDFLVEKKKIMDIGPFTIERFVHILAGAKTIVWSGPMGLFERKKFSYGSTAIARAIARARAFTVAGGGETTELITFLKLQKKLSFVSTGGGAMLEFLTHGTLPGIEALG